MLRPCTQAPPGTKISTGAGCGRQILAAPDVEHLRGVVAVVDRAAVEVAALAQRIPDRRRPFRRGPFEVEIGGRHHPAQGRDGHRVGAFPIPAAFVVGALGRAVPLGCSGDEFGREPGTPDAHRGHATQRLQVLADHR